MNPKATWGISSLVLIGLGGFAIATGRERSELTVAEMMADAWTYGTGKITYNNGAGNANDLGVGTSSPGWQVHSVWDGTTKGAIYGQSTTTTSSTAQGVQGRSAGYGTGAAGVAGYATGTGANRGVYGQTDSGDNGAAGVYGYNSAGASSGSGVWGKTPSSNGRGVFGEASSASGPTIGVYGTAASAGGYAVYGYNSSTGSDSTSVYGESPSQTGRGVFGYATATLGANRGVVGRSDSSGGIGVYAEAAGDTGSNAGIYARTASGSGVAGLFNGNVTIIGALAKSSGTFKIDHPLDPANKYLSHSFVESPDMKNVYDGVVDVDAAGNAQVELPSYFSALNRDFRYQLTSIGSPAPLLHVSSEVEDNVFSISGGMPGTRVSWQVTGIRKDPWAVAHPVIVEEEKAAEDKGHYLVPELYGRSAAEGILENRFPLHAPAEDSPAEPAGR